MVLADTNMREVMNMLTENEIRDVINNKLNSISDPVKIIFSNTICLDCGEEGDVRWKIHYVSILQFTKTLG